MPDRTALYRRWRPQTFTQIVGQHHVTRTLRNAIASGQVAHAYLLAGPRGTGKTSVARLIAKAVNCPRAKDGEPCDTCPSCVAIREGRFLDLIEIDAASNRGIDEMRDLREKVRFTPSEGQYKVYVIDEAHQLTPEAFNALLKTLEEPPAHAIFVLATTESQKIPATIVSRTQRFDLRRISHPEVVRQLEHVAAAEGLQAEKAALEAIARHAQGSLRDAESILEQVTAFSDGTMKLADVDDLLGVSDWDEVAELFDALAAADGSGAVALVGRLIDGGRDLHLFARRAIEHVRALVLVRYTGKPPETLGEAAAAKLNEQAPRFAPDRLARIAKRLVEAEQQLRTGDGTPLPLELAVLELTAGGSDPASAAPAGPVSGRGARSIGVRGTPDPSAGASAPAHRASLPSKADLASTRLLSAGSELPAMPQSGSSPPAGAARASVTSRAAPAPNVRPGDVAGGAAGPTRDAVTTADQSLASEETGTSPTSEARLAASPGRALTSTTSTNGPHLGIDSVREAWSVVVEETRSRSVTRAAQLVAAELMAVEGTTVVVGFADDFARDLWQDRQRPELERELSSALGVPVRVKCVRQQAAPTAAPATDDPMLRAALETFRRPERILEVE